MTDMIDLRARSGASPAGAPTAGPTEDDAASTVDEAGVVVVDEQPEPKAGGGRARLIVLLVLGAVLVYLMLEVFLLPVAARQRQQHLRDEYSIARADLTDGEASLLLQIPVIGVDQVVTQGATPSMLRGGPGWRAGSAPPGQGNTVILGRSTRWGYQFGDIGKLKGGDRIYVRTRDGRVYTYKVSRVRTVDADRTSYLRAGGANRLTLVTSSGGPLDTRRVVVQASPNGAQPEVPKDLKRKVNNTADVGRYDERGNGGLLLLVAGTIVLAIGIYAFHELRRRYAVMTTLVVAGPAIALGVVLLMFNLDAFLPITY